MVKDARRHRRIPYIGPVAVSWTERGEVRYARGKCLNVAESGVRLELPVAIPPRTEISLNAERINVSGSARVRHVTRYGSKFLVGIELSHTLKAAALTALREPQDEPTPVIV
jgi:hypothetical protein